MAIDGEWTALQDLRRDHKAGDFVVVAPDGWDTFYINSLDGKTLYGDFFLRELMPYIERTYRIRAERTTRGITGFSMVKTGAAAHPAILFSGMECRTPPQWPLPALSGRAGIARWQRPFALARKMPYA